MLNGKKYVTVNTDAGYKDGHGGTYGIWVTTDTLRFKFHGTFQTVKDSLEAEMAAICTALKFMYNDHLSFLDCDVIVINCDSKEAIRHLTNQGNVKFERFHKAYNLLGYNITNRFPRVKIRFKHVKGHSKNTEARKYVNNWCDAMARKARG